MDHSDMDHSDMKRLWGGLDPEVFTTTSQENERENESNGDKDSGNEGRSEDRDGEAGGYAFADHALADGGLANGTEQQNAEAAAHPPTLLGLPEGTNAGEVILVNKRDIMVLQLVIVRLVEKGILDAEDVMRMKKDANQQIRESHPDIAEK